jgi:hypothetical protein
LYADDGGGILSEKLMFNITIVGDVTVRASAPTTFSVSYGTAVITMLCAVAALFPQGTEMH